MENVDAERGKKLNELGELIYPIILATHRVLQSASYSLDSITKLHLRTIQAIADLTDSCFKIWRLSERVQQDGNSFDRYARHSIEHPMMWHKDDVVKLSTYLSKGDKLGNKASVFAQMTNRITKEFSRNLGLLLTAEKGIFDECNMPEWKESLPDEIKVFNKGGQQVEAIDKPKFLELLKQSSIEFSLEKKRWEFTEQTAG